MAPDVSDVPAPKVDPDHGAAECADVLKDPSDLGEEVAADLPLDNVPMSKEGAMEQCYEISPSTKWDGYLCYIIVFTVFYVCFSTLFLFFN